MRYDSRIMLATACIGLLATSVPALSRPAHHHHHRHLTRQQVVERMAAVQKPATGWPALVIEARKYMGTNPTDRKRLWCATFMNFVLAKLGYPGTNSDAAKSFAYYGRRISKPRIGAIAVLRRGKEGGHVGVVSGVDPNGNPIIISGNHNHRVGEGIYPRSRVIAYVMPTERHPKTIQLAARSQASPIPASPIPDKGVDSPITELIAAIEAEQARAEKPARTAAPPPAVRHRLVQQLPETQRVAQQTLRRAAPSRPQPQSPADSDNPFGPLLATLFGPDDRVTSQPSRRPQPQNRPRAKRKRPSRLAANTAR
jgi:uncharacterized protein (TIGR02594 family)